MPNRRAGGSDASVRRTLDVICLALGIQMSGDWLPEAETRGSYPKLASDIGRVRASRLDDGEGPFQLGSVSNILEKDDIVRDM